MNKIQIKILKAKVGQRLAALGNYIVLAVLVVP